MATPPHRHVLANRPHASVSAVWRFTIRALTLVPILTFTACAPGPTPTDLPLFGSGYRFAGDICRRVGEDAFTSPFLDDAADLVACPTGAGNDATFVNATEAREVARRDGYMLYTVPTR